MRVVRSGRRFAGSRSEAGGGAVELTTGSGTVQRLANEEREQRDGCDRRDPRTLRGEHRQAEAAFAPPDTALRTRRFSASPSGGSFTSAVPSK